MSAKKVLAEFCDDVEAVGGIVKLRGGWNALAVDEEWVDLAETYVKACRVLKRNPVVTKQGDES